QGHGRRAGAGADPRQRAEPGGRPDADAEGIHGRRGNRGDEGEVRQHHPDRALLHAAGHCQCGAVFRLRRSEFHHRRLHGSGWRPMHLKALPALLLTAALLAGTAAAQQQAPATATPEQKPAEQKPAEQKPAEQKTPAKKPAPPKDANAPRNRTMHFELPPLVPIAEVPRGKPVMIQGTVLSPQPTTFVLNDGNASLVINLGPTW